MPSKNLYLVTFQLILLFLIENIYDQLKSVLFSLAFSAF